MKHKYNCPCCHVQSEVKIEKHETRVRKFVVGYPENMLAKPVYDHSAHTIVCPVCKHRTHFMVMMPPELPEPTVTARRSDE